MPIDICVLHNGRGILYHCHGKVNGRDFIDANRRLLAFKDRLKHVRYGLVDETAINGIQLSETDMLKIAVQDKKIAARVPRGAVVAVIANDEFSHELTRVWALFVAHTGWETMAFRAKWKAEGWIAEKVKENFGIDLLSDTGVAAG